MRGHSDLEMLKVINDPIRKELYKGIILNYFEEEKIKNKKR